MTPVAIITGAWQGIGVGPVEAYRRAGYAVGGTSRSISASDEPGFLTVRGDITQADTPQRVVDEATRRFGRIDSRVNNAGVFIAITQRAVRPMLLQCRGHIVNLSSLVDNANIDGGQSAGH